MCGLSSTHVHRSRPKPRLTARHPPARELPRGRQGQEAHASEPVRLAARAYRRLQGAVERRHSHPARPGGDQHRPLPAAWHRRRSARHGAQDRPRSADRTRGQPLPGPHSGARRQPDPRSRLEARGFARARRRPPPPALAPSSAWGPSTRRNFMVPSTGWRSARRISRRRWPDAISPAARWCSTT